MSMSPELKAILKRMAIPAVFLSVVTVVWWQRGQEAKEQWAQQAEAQQPLTSLWGETMGTTWTVRIPGELNPEAQERLQKAITQALEGVNQSMSTYLPTSEISRFGQQPVDVAFEASPLFFEVMSAAQQVHKESEGAFDPTVGPLVQLWGFGPDPSRSDLPADEDIGSALARVDFGAISFGEDAAGGKTLTRSRDDIRVDLSAIAKGYAVDRVAQTLEQAGHLSYMVEVGGEIRVGQAKPASQPQGEGSPWRIAVERPTQEGGVFQVVPMTQAAMATSGDYRNFFTVDGQRFSHTIDPKTGRPVEHTLASVSVLHSSCMMADAYATALSVMGPEQGMAFAEQQGLAVLMLVRDGEQLQALRSSNFPAPQQ